MTLLWSVMKTKDLYQQSNFDHIAYSYIHCSNMCTELQSGATLNPVLSGHSKIDKTNILMAIGSLMKVESVAECSPWSILQYF